MTHTTRWLTLSALLVPAVLAGCQSESESAYVDTAETYADLSEAPAGEASAADDLALDGPTPAFTRAASAPSSAPSSASQAPADPPADLGRQLRRSADLRISADDYGATVRQARALAGQFGGLVAGEDGASYGETAETTLTLRVPSGRFDAALDALAALGTVESRHVAVEDVTSQVVDLEARLRAKRAAEERYVALIGQAASVSEMLDVQGRLDGVRAEIEVMESQARALRGSVALSTIRATVTGPAAMPTAAPGLWALAGSAVASGWHGLWAVVIGLLPLWPLAVVIGVALVVWRRMPPRVAA